MPHTRATALLRLLLTLARCPHAQAPRQARDDAELQAWDQSAARRQVHTVLTVVTRSARADVLAAVRHELRLPLGPAAVPEGALHLIGADDSSITIGSVLRRGSTFSGELIVRDRRSGAVAEYAVAIWHQRDGDVHGLRQLQWVRATVVAAVRSIDPDAEVSDAAETPE